MIRRAPKRVWFEYDDGTFYRNCQLIHRESDAAAKAGRFRLAMKLHDEWEETFRRGVQYKEQLGRGEISVPAPRTPLSVLLPGLVGRVPAERLAEWDADDRSRPHLPGDPKFRWAWQS